MNAPMTPDEMDSFLDQVEAARTAAFPNDTVVLPATEKTQCARSLETAPKWSERPGWSSLAVSRGPMYDLCPKHTQGALGPNPVEFKA